ncbi:MAG: transglutaminase domain-containing protein [Chitinophagaceae bacterium]|nr:transglutaminase domain-containing protein [Chitinophagaceae bacterium]
MRMLFCIAFVLSSVFAGAQKLPSHFNHIDREVQNIDADSPEMLAYRLTSFCKTDLEKVRAIFRWITENIAYRVPGNSRNTSSDLFIPEEADTTFELRRVNEDIAKRVLKKRSAVCDGYARLFKILCDYAGVKSEIISGYAKGNMYRNSTKFRSNHSWNAVFLDTAWHLLDVTWASGHSTYSSNEFIKQYNDYYFLTPPELFIKDHYPEDPYWTLMPGLPVPREFNQTPFKHKSFSKYSIVSFKPSGGIIEASVGDTIRLELQVSDIYKDKGIASDPFFDSLVLQRSAAWAFVNPVAVVQGRKIRYQYAVESADMEWLHIMYNDDIIMRYRLSIRKDEAALK